MSKLERSLACVALVLMASATSAVAQDISDAADLTAVIALNGKPCGKVVNAAKRGDNDYVATCEDGNRYHVYVKDGRVVVDKTS
ncbi:MAG TPA: hypothetical protein VM692_11280 [Gammaproteobacteria bacterium]|nr:hypothetical protein [Gammaproteobacteria bacterium]